MKPTDTELREQLKEVDGLDVDVSSWEADFIESIAFKSEGDLSDKERKKAQEIVDKYLNGEE